VTRPERLWVVIVGALLTIKHRLPVIRNRAVPVRIRGIGTVWLADWSQLMVAWEVFLMDAYGEDAMPEHATTILDIGANVGLASRVLRSRYPLSRILAVEADPSAARLAARNLRESDVEVINVAVAPSPGTVELRRVRGQSWASSTVGDKGERIPVRAVDLDSLIDRLGRVSILKIDIEGAEHAVLGASKRLEAVDWIVGEVHPLRGTTTEGFFSLLRDFDILQRSIVGEKGTFIAHRRSLSRPAATPSEEVREP
jgi:FkbM family methyltransferase